jgi:small subunit ribosomal protein S24e
MFPKKTLEQFLYFIALQNLKKMAPLKKAKAEFTVRTTQFKTNKLLNRRQFIVEVTHGANWNGTVPRKQIAKKLAQLYKVADENCVSVFGLKTAFGGGKTTGFGLIYGDLATVKRVEPNYRLQRLGMGRKRGAARKSIKERRNRAKADRGRAKNRAAAAGKKK